MFTVLPAQHFMEECVFHIGCPSCKVTGRNVYHAIDCAELFRICRILELAPARKKKAPETIQEQLEECEWIKMEVPKGSITIIDERG